MKKHKAKRQAISSISGRGMHKHSACGQIVLGFGKDEHVKSAHRGKAVEWERMGDT
jgi:hypothetical protein